jgi:prefoldin subunit 5
MVDTTTHEDINKRLDTIEKILMEMRDELRALNQRVREAEGGGIEVKGE